MTKINIMGTIFGTSGYASHTRQLANAIYEINKETHLDTMGFDGWEKEVTDNEMAMIKNPYYKDGILLAVMLPNQWQLELSNQYSKFYGYCVWEGSNVPRFWLDIFADCRVDKIIVPSEHTREAIFNTINKSNMRESYYKIIIDKIEVISHGVNLELFKKQDVKIKLDDRFRFIVNKGWASGMNDRGGVQFALKAFNEEFSKDENVEMLVKINAAYCGPNWNIQNELSKLDLRPEGGLININMQNVPFNKIPELYFMGDVFVSPNMSESFGLPMAEAMACGLPVITTSFGGQTDFVNNENGWLIPYTLIPVDWDISYEGVSWAVPDMIELRKAMRDAYNNRDSVTKRKGVKSSEDILVFSWKRTAEKILSL